MAIGRTERKKSFVPSLLFSFLSFRFSHAKQIENKLKPSFSFLPSIKRRKHKNQSNTKIKPLMEEDLSEYQIQSMKEAFTLFATKDGGKISPSHLGVLMRSLGANPTEAQLRSIILEESLTEPFNFTRFIDFMSKYFRPEPFDSQLRDAFKVIDKEGTGFVAVLELRHILTSIGEKLEVSEFDEWIKNVDVGADGRIYIKDFIARMVAI